MFDRTFVNRSISSPSHVTVTENRAPTDDSVRLLAEMEQATMKRILGKLRLEGNTIDCQIFEFHSLTAERVLGIAIVVNGERTMLEVEFKPWLSNDEKVQVAYEAIGQHLAAHIMGKVSRAVWYGVNDA